MEAFYKELDKHVEAGWEQIKQGQFWTFCMDNTMPVELYQLVMLQIHHYTRFNSINQAACAYNTDMNETALLRFVYKHASEELGHERMVIRDLESIGAMPKTLPSPLPPTQALISYLNDVALRMGAIPRLGYSYWAEEVYDHIQPLLDKFRADLKLQDNNMSFFVAHSHIDAKHSEEVRQAMEKAVKTDAQKQQVIDVCKVTLYLTGQLLEEAYRVYEQSLKSGLAKAS